MPGVADINSRGGLDRNLARSVHETLAATLGPGWHRDRPVAEVGLLVLGACAVNMGRSARAANATPDRVTTVVRVARRVCGELGVDIDEDLR